MNSIWIRYYREVEKREMVSHMDFLCSLLGNEVRKVEVVESWRASGDRHPGHNLRSSPLMPMSVEFGKGQMD